MTLPEDPRITEFREWNRNLDKITDQATIQAQIEALEGYGEDFWVAYAERMRQSSIEMFGRLVLDE